MFSAGGTLTVTGSTVSGNTAGANGGGSYSGGAARRSDCGARSRSPAPHFSGNECGLPAVEPSSAMAMPWRPSPTSTFIDNISGDAGGGLEAGGRSSLTIERRVQRQRRPPERAAAPGRDRTDGHDHRFHVHRQLRRVAVDVECSERRIGRRPVHPERPDHHQGSTFAGNSATETGGGLALDNFGDAIVRDTAVHHNTAVHDGGGIENSGGLVTFETPDHHQQPRRRRRRRYPQLVQR